MLGKRLSLRRSRPGAGLTLVELLVAMTLLLVVLAAIYTIWFGLQRTYSFTDPDLQAQDQARSAMSEMVEYIRTARVPTSAPSEDLNLVVPFADKNTLVVWTDVSRDASHTLELVRYRLDTPSRSIYRDTSPTGDITFLNAVSVKLIHNWVSNGAQQPLFTYTDSNGTVLSTPVSDPTQIRTISIDLLIDVDPAHAPNAHELKSSVQPRNLRQY